VGTRISSTENDKSEGESFNCCISLPIENLIHKKVLLVTQHHMVAHINNLDKIWILARHLYCLPV